MYRLSTVLLLNVFLASSAWAEDVAAFLLVQGDVSVSSSEGAFEQVVVGTSLERDDLIKTDWDSAAILQLHNNHLVRIDEDLELKVSDLVLLDAPLSTADFKTQLDTLLYPEERASMDGIERAERVAGWHARVTASYAPTTSYNFEDDIVEGQMLAPDGEYLASKEADDEDGGATRGRSAPAKSGGGGGKKKSAKKPSAADDVLAEIQRQAEENARREWERVEQGMEEQSELRSGTGGVSVADAVDPQPMLIGVRSAEEIEALFTVEGELRQCLTEWAVQLPVPVQELQIVLRVKNDAVSRVTVRGGLMPPDCARQILVGMAISDKVDKVTVSFPVAPQQP
ncbi:MAG: hypothetical protein HN348_20965 [Proteobacteria bacterium]|jgi:hypothetical protein|nr:hypothetical protein [Pseudomonadota bacterium]